MRGDSAAGISRARQAARTFTDCLAPAPGPDTADTLVLVVSELVTNALRHGGGCCTLRLSAGPGTVTAAVSDPNPAHPRERTPQRRQRRLRLAHDSPPHQPPDHHHRPRRKAFTPNAPSNSNRIRGVPPQDNPARRSCGASCRRRSCQKPATATGSATRAPTPT
ncbi:ATP-binding protein [Streptomyces sp. 21So2-11]|uniref:ATP-binding protein n=1 Tax=Streptomyces sp. 21So2-11 TaxID=3144408 RepID=UPI00321B127D